MSSDEKPSQNELLFVQLVSLFQVTAMQHMGKLPNPVTNTIERDLEQARISVDILGMIKEKTKGNLNKIEEEFLNKVVFESQMNYLDELKKPEEPKEKADDAAEGAAADPRSSAGSRDAAHEKPQSDASGPKAGTDAAESETEGGTDAEEKKD